MGENSGFRIRRIDVGTDKGEGFAGTGDEVYAGDEGPATSASFTNVDCVWGDSVGRIFSCDTNSHVVLVIDTRTVGNRITTFAGTGALGGGGDNGSV